MSKTACDSYNMEQTVKPLRDFINNPVAHDIIHNGVTFQVAGLTDSSGFSESHEVRQPCQNISDSRNLYAGHSKEEAQ
ncbi:hypothetical protein MKW98_029149 [Papaver atlanticum]|uniref:Uncharacterized protein n=1 Tax=Papaver atlanticum TaxID=357466 RepID=A0AAD4XAG7_9MAGN|nr:hypothetical protein MKW98_029149 [Papaver atlanticum]